MSGVMSINKPGFLQGVNYLSPLRYALHNLAPYSLRDLHFSCDDAQRLPDGRCPIETGEQVLELYQLDAEALRNIVALGACTVVSRLLAYVYVNCDCR